MFHIKIKKWNFKSFMASFAISMLMVLFFNNDDYKNTKISSNKVLFVQGAALGKVRRTHVSQRFLTVVNESGRKFDIYWINRGAKTPDEQFISNTSGEGCAYGSSTAINTYVGHEFKIEELPSSKTGTCLYTTCRTAFFQAQDADEQEIVVDKDFGLSYSDKHERARKEAKEALQPCRDKFLSPSNAMDLSESSLQLMVRCMEQQMNASVAKKIEEQEFQSSLRTTMGSQLAPYACIDSNYTTSEETLNQTWYYVDRESTYYEQHELRLMHDYPTSQIYLSYDFLKPSECNAIQKESTDNVGVNWSVLSAKSTNIGVKTTLSRLSSKIQSLSSELLKIQNVKMTKGEVFLTWHQDEMGTPDPSHCAADAMDGVCKASLMTTKIVPKEQELAKIFIFCDNPALETDETIDDVVAMGTGALHFPHAGIHIRPKPHMLVFAKFQPSNDKNIDEPDPFLQEYHMCPNHSVWTHTIYEQ